MAGLMRPEDIPQELIDILDARAGKKHGRTGSVVTCLAEILTRYDTIKAAGPGDGLHRDPDWCQRCQTPLQPFRGASPEFPVPSFICPECGMVTRCACDGCEVLAAVVYS
jgi:hypothetical protein